MINILIKNKSDIFLWCDEKNKCGPTSEGVSVQSESIFLIVLFPKHMINFPVLVNCSN